ncbi:MAG: hypothetical protein ACXWCP_07325 [Burkholderiales bacterium]
MREDLDNHRRLFDGGDNLKVAVSDRSVPGLPLHIVARTFTAEAVHDATIGAAECFGAMGVMRDMPMQKYVHDAMGASARARSRQRDETRDRRSARRL